MEKLNINPIQYDMNRTLKHWLTFLLLMILLSFLFWLKDKKGKEFIVDDRSVVSQQNHNFSTPAETGSIPPVSPDGIAVRETDEQRERRLELDLMRALDSPINFWGKVVDEQGDPVSGSRVEMSITNKFSWNPTEKNTKTEYIRISDSNGLFSLLNKKGGSLYVNVSKDGYASLIDNQTGRDFATADLSYSDENDHMYFKIPQKDKPMIFVLRKKYPIANLAYSFKKHVSIQKEGDAQELDLTVAGKTIRIEIRCWSSSLVPFTYDRYDWRAEIKIEDGELQPIAELDPVTAPTEGYEQVFKIEMPKNTEKNWLRSSPNGQRDFWFRFDDGTYAKARIEVKTGRRHEVDAEVWYNLDGTNHFEQ